MELAVLFVMVGFLIGTLVGYFSAEAHQITPRQVYEVIERFKMVTGGRMTTEAYNQLLDAIAYEVIHHDE